MGELNYVLQVGLKDGLIWFPIVVGIGILYSHLKILDISIDGIVIASGIVCGFTWNLTNSYLLSLTSSIIAGIILAIIVCFSIFRLRIHPIMSGIIFSLAIHSISVVLIGESILLSETKLISGLLTIPTWLIILTVLIFISVEYFFSHGLGIEIRAFGDNNLINTRRNPTLLAYVTYALAGALYGLGAAIYSHSEGIARSGGNFDFLVIGLAAFLSTDRIVWLITWITKKGEYISEGKHLPIKNIIHYTVKLWNLVSTKAILGVIFFQTVVFYVIFRTSNPVYWKIVFSFILLVTLINYEFISDYRKTFAIGKKKEIDREKRYKSEALIMNNLYMTYKIGIENRNVFKSAEASFLRGINIIRGPNGSGKSTLLKIIKGLVGPQSGQMLYEKNDLLNLPSYKRHVFFIDQNPFDICAPNLSVIENLSTAIPGYSGVRTVCSSKRILHILSKELASIGVKPIADFHSSFWEKETRSLSGGEVQTICLYMGILSNKPIVLLDEPTTGLDNFNFERLLMILKALGNKKIILITTHDMRLSIIKSSDFIIENYTLVKES